MARVLAIWCPDWPVAAAGVPATEPVAVLDAGRVLACSLAARAEGVRPGQRRRQAQECCPELELIAHDPDRDARAFEPVLVAVESLTPRIEVLRPGECAFPARGAARYHGGEATLTAKVLATVDQVLGVLGRCQVGIADGRFAASLAARLAPRSRLARFRRRSRLARSYCRPRFARHRCRRVGRWTPLDRPLWGDAWFPGALSRRGSGAPRAHRSTYPPGPAHPRRPGGPAAGPHGRPFRARRHTGTPAGHWPGRASPREPSSTTRARGRG